MRAACLVLLVLAAGPVAAQDGSALDAADAALARGDTTAAFEALRDAADGGAEQSRLAEMLLRGWGTPADTVAALDALGRAVWETDDWAAFDALLRLAELTRGDAVRVVARQQVAPGLVVVTTSVAVLPTYWVSTDCATPPSRVLGQESAPPKWRIDRIVLERGGALLVLDSRCMGQDWPVDDERFSVGSETVIETAGGWIQGAFADGAASYSVGWDAVTGARLFDD